MKRFLRETWELWYWAMFCPSRLQQRMNEWVPAEEEDGLRSDTHSCDILWFKPNYRFIAQFLLLIFLFSLPLMWRVVLYGQQGEQGLNLLLLLLLFGTIVIAYSIGIFCVSISFNIPLVVYFVDPVNPQNYLNLVNQVLPMFAVGFILGLVVLLVMPLFVIALNILEMIWPNISGGVVGSIVAIIMGSIVEIFMVSIVMSIMGSIVMSVIVTIATLPLPLFLLICWLIGASLSPIMQNWLAITIAIMLTALGFDHLNWMSFLAVPVTLMSYYRLPDYLIITYINFLFVDRNPVQLLHSLPPYTTELVWMPLLNHDRILAAAFRSDASTTLATLHKIQESPLPGLKFTIQQALPQMITDQLTAITNISELIAIATPEHPFLPLLAPTFYKAETLETENRIIQRVSSITNSLIHILSFLILDVSGYGMKFPTGEIIYLFHIEEDGSDINKLLPRLQIVAKDVDAALKGGNPAIQERGLVNILNNLRSLHEKLYGLGLTTRAVKRWQPVLVRWQRIIELELQEQQKQSQDELLNPFQYGNPLRSDRANLFRGRQKFADEIVRLILDRNRPTLVLHGPRRCGKTSFLYNLPRLLPSSLLPVYLDLQSSAITTDEAAFCQGLVRAIHRDSRSQGIELPITPTRQEFLETPYITLEDWLEQALPRLGERRLLLNLDEFEKIGIAIKEKRLSLNLFDELRHLIQHYDSLAFLFSGVQTLDELGPNWSSYFISVVPLEMTYLEPDEAESLLTNPDPEFALHYDRGIVEEIIQLTRCQPYLLQLLGSALVTQANLNHTQLVTPDLLQAAIPEAFTNGEPYFTNVWTEFTGNNPAEIIAGQEFLLELANGLAPGNSQDLTDAAIRRLRRYHAIEQTDNGYVFEVPLLERWVRERAVKNSNY